jgi:hypothetical protein
MKSVLILSALGSIDSLPGADCCDTLCRLKRWMALNMASSTGCSSEFRLLQKVVVDGGCVA